MVSNMNYIKVNNDELYHYGMPKRSGRYPYGSGDRPYQHGTRKAGDVRKASELTTKELQEYNSRRKAEDKYNQYQKQDRRKESNIEKFETANQISNNVNNIYNNTSRQIDEMFREEHRQQKANIDLSKVSDEDLRKAVNRMQLERQYRDLSPVTISDGEKKVKQIMSAIGPVLSTTASVLAITVAVKELILKGK